MNHTRPFEFEDGEAFVSPSKKNEEVKADANSTNSKLQDRDTWGGRFDFLLACCGTAVGLGNVWRFPYLCYKNGGGAFLIPYLISVVACGVPIFLLEIAVGQSTQLGTIKSWNAICPLFSGVGIASTVIVSIAVCYYAVILSWALFYLFQSFKTELPWASCNNSWNDPLKCQENYTFVKTLNLTEAERKENFTSPILEYWENEVLQISKGIETPGAMRWELAGCLLFVWLVCFFIIFKGTRSTGKAMYFTATFPYVMLLILLIRGITLPGAWKGIEFYLKPNITKLTEPQVWIDAGTQVYFSYSLCVGALITLGSFNHYNRNCLRDTIIIACVNSGTSFVAGFAIFSALGYMASEQGMEVSDVAEKGPGLAFIAYPKEVLLLPLSQLWSCLFFIMIFLLGITTVSTDILAIVTSLGDLFPKLYRGSKIRQTAAMGIQCFICFLIGLSMVTQGGMYILQLLDFYGPSGFAVLWTGMWQCIIVGWFYGAEKFYDILEDMIGYRPNAYYKIAWKFAAPVLNVAIFVFAIVKYEPLTYNKTYDYPIWAHAIGWTLALVSMVCLPVRAAYVLVTSEGSTWGEKFNNSMKLQTMIVHCKDNRLANTSLNNETITSSKQPYYAGYSNVRNARTSI